MATRVPNPQNGIVAELLAIANGDWHLIIKAGTWVEGRLCVDRALLKKLVNEKENHDAKRNKSTDR